MAHYYFLAILNCGTLWIKVRPELNSPYEDDTKYYFNEIKYRATVPWHIFWEPLLKAQPSI